mmetsp:Transcript_32829/g.87191  ORF Transcript_32829/g.87191 Transcript_32829/m.87191 type:complete len:253 (-) Transcript_32829:366-1124(-)
MWVHHATSMTSRCRGARDTPANLCVDVHGAASRGMPMPLRTSMLLFFHFGSSGAASGPAGAACGRRRSASTSRIDMTHVGGAFCLSATRPCTLDEMASQARCPPSSSTARTTYNRGRLHVIHGLLFNLNTQWPLKWVVPQRRFTFSISPRKFCRGVRARSWNCEWKPSTCSRIKHFGKIARATASTESSSAKVEPNKLWSVHRLVDLTRVKGWQGVQHTNMSTWSGGGRLQECALGWRRHGRDEAISPMVFQ